MMLRQVLSHQRPASIPIMLSQIVNALFRVVRRSVRIAFLSVETPMPRKSLTMVIRDSTSKKISPQKAAPISDSSSDFSENEDEFKK